MPANLDVSGNCSVAVMNKDIMMFHATL